MKFNNQNLEDCTIGGWEPGQGESGEAEDLGYSIQNDGSYVVYNADGLLAWNEAAQKDVSINCSLTADIDLTGKEWAQIGKGPGYSGVFNGQGHRITGLNFSATRTELFGFLDFHGVIKNLQLRKTDKISILRNRILALSAMCLIETTF